MRRRKARPKAAVLSPRSKGQCLVALEAGQYQFEVQHQRDPRTVVALKTGVINVTGAAAIDLNALRVKPAIYGPSRRAMTIDDLLIRTTRPTGGISWKPVTTAKTTTPLTLRQGRTHGREYFRPARTGPRTGTRASGWGVAGGWLRRLSSPRAQQL